jgi:hypothetical protein
MKNKFIRHSNAVADGQTAITPTASIDMQGYERCTFVVAWGAIAPTGVQSIEVHQSSASDGSGDAFTALLGSKVVVTDADDNKLTTVEIYRPRERYLKCVVNRGTADSAIDGIVALLSNKGGRFVTDATVSGSEVHASPAEGTA